MELRENFKLNHNIVTLS